MTRVNRKHIIVSILGVFFMFGFGYVCPTWGSVTRMGVQYLGILIGWIVMCAFGIPMSMASVMSIAACALPGLLYRCNGYYRKHRLKFHCTGTVHFCFGLCF